MKNTNSKKTLMSNTLFCLTTEGRKMEQLENEIGVKPGYFVEKGKETGCELDVNVVMALAKDLHITVDTLLGVDLTALSPNARYRVMFLDKLMQDTVKDQLDWQRESDVYLKYGVETEFGDPNHPLFEERTFTETTEEGRTLEVTRVVFPSYSYDVYTDIQGEGFHLILKDGSVLYIMNVRGTTRFVADPDAYAKEIWICPSEGEKQFICSSQDIPEVANLVERLYAEVRNNAMHAKIRPDIKNILDGYMASEDGPDEEIDI